MRCQLSKDARLSLSSRKVKPVEAAQCQSFPKMPVRDVRGQMAADGCWSNHCWLLRGNLKHSNGLPRLGFCQAQIWLPHLAATTGEMQPAADSANRGGSAVGSGSFAPWRCLWVGGGQQNDNPGKGRVPDANILCKSETCEWSTA